MKRGHFFIIYFIVYMMVAVTILIKIFTFEIAKNELRQLDLAISIAGEKTAKALNNHVYEEDVKGFLEETWVYAFSFAMNETEVYEIEENRAIIDRIDIGINGERISDFGRLMLVTDEDSLSLYIVLNDFTIYTPFRSFVVSREYYKEIER